MIEWLFTKTQKWSDGEKMTAPIKEKERKECCVKARRIQRDGRSWDIIPEPMKPFTEPDATARLSLKEWRESMGTSSTGTGHKAVEKPIKVKVKKEPKPRKARPKKPHKERYSRPVRCVETGEVFISGKAAGRSIGREEGAGIRGAIVKGHKAGGYHWEYYDKQSSPDSGIE